MIKKILLSFSLAILFSNIFFIDAGSVLIGDGGDNYEFFGFMHLARENLLSKKLPFSHTNTLRYPNGFDFSYGFDGVAPVFLGAILGMVFRPILAYNLSVVLILFLNIFCSILFFEKLGNLYGVSREEEIRFVLAGLIFGAAPYVFARINSHLNLAFVAGMPAMTYYSVLLHKNIVQGIEIKPFKILVGLVFSLIFVGLGSLQYLILIFLILPIPAFIIFKRHLQKYRLFIKENLQGVLISFILFLTIFLFFWGGYVKAVMTSNINIVDRAGKFTQPHPADVFLPNQYLGEVWGILNPSEKSIEKVITVGLLELIILGVILCKARSIQERLFGFGVFFVYLLLSFGIINLPFYHEGGRSVVLISLIIAFAVSVRKDILVKKPIVGLFLTFILVERLFFNIQTARPVAAEVLENQISKLSGKAVLNVPLSKYNPYRTALPVFYKKNIIDGFFHYTADTAQTQETMNKDYFMRLTCSSEREDALMYEFEPQARQDALKTFEKNDIGAIAVFKNEKAGNFLSRDCENVRNWWYYLNPETLTLIKDTGGINKQTMQLRSYNPNNIVRIYFEKAGRLVIDGMYASPEELSALTITIPDGNQTHPDWKPTSEGYGAKLSPPFEYEGKAGDSIYIQNNKKSAQSRYLSIYYLFEPDNRQPQRDPMPLELLYSDYDVEIYKVNY